VESPATYRLMEVEKRADRGDSDMLLDGTKDRPMLLEDRNRVLDRGKGPATKKTTDIEVYKEGVQEKDNSHMASGSGPPEHTLNLNKTQAHLTQLLGLSSKPKTAMFTEPFSDFINSNWGEAKHPFKHSIMDWELGKHMQMEEGEPKTRNQRIEEAQAEDMTQEEDSIAFEGETNSYCMSGGDSSFLESFENQLVTYNEPEPLSIEENLTEEMIETRATIWVHLNVIKLGQAFGAAIKGCEKEAYALCMKLDQKRYLERHAGKGKSSNSNNNTIPKELKNLMFDMKFKDGEPRISGRRLTIMHR